MPLLSKGKCLQCRFSCKRCHLCLSDAVVTLPSGIYLQIIKCSASWTQTLLVPPPVCLSSLHLPPGHRRILENSTRLCCTLLLSECLLWVLYGGDRLRNTLLGTLHAGTEHTVPHFHLFCRTQRQCNVAVFFLGLQTVYVVQDTPCEAATQACMRRIRCIVKRSVTSLAIMSS